MAFFGLHMLCQKHRRWQIRPPTTQPTAAGGSPKGPSSRRVVLVLNYVIYISTIPHVSVVRLEKFFELWMVIRRCCVTLHICKSVFRKSLLENVEVFRSKRRDGQHSLSYRYLWQVAFCVPVSHIFVLCFRDFVMPSPIVLQTR